MGVITIGMCEAAAVELEQQRSALEILRAAIFRVEAPGADSPYDEEDERAVKVFEDVQDGILERIDLSIKQVEGWVRMNARILARMQRMEKEEIGG